MQYWIGLIQFGLQNDLIVFEEIKAQVHFIMAQNVLVKLMAQNILVKLLQFYFNILP